MKRKPRIGAAIDAPFDYVDEYGNYLMLSRRWIRRIKAFVRLGELYDDARDAIADEKFARATRLMRKMQSVLNMELGKED